MKGITRIARRLMLVFLVIVASSTMFFSSPAVAATSSLTLLTPYNFETEVAESDKPVLVILAPESVLQNYPSYLERTKAEAEQICGDKYKIVVGKVEENVADYIIDSVKDQYVPSIIGFKNGQQATQRVDLIPDLPSQAVYALLYVKQLLDEVS